MISFTKLLCGGSAWGDELRYGEAAGANPCGVGPGRGPVVVWNLTRSCNLRCLHCYADSYPGRFAGELETYEALQVIADLARLRVPAILWSGGEPLLRRDLFQLIEAAGERGIRSTLSTNGTLIDEETARRCRQAGVSYVGISLDGPEAVHDVLRARKGAFRRALEGIRHCRAVGQKVGLRFTLTRTNVPFLPEIFALVEEEDIQRVCFYHLVYAGRGRGLVGQALSAAETRRAVDAVAAWTRSQWRRGRACEVLTVDNHADGVYLYLKLQEEEPRRAERVRALLARSGGNRSGMAVGNIDFLGDVHPDQFTMGRTLGNVRERPFSRIWGPDGHPLLSALRNRSRHLQGRCRRCPFLPLCNGNFRARAQAATGDFWASDPACYLTDRELEQGRLLAG